jgi:hypothetical protein
MAPKKKKERKKEKAKSQAPMAHTCNPSYSGGKIRRTVVRSQPEQIIHETLT